MSATNNLLSSPSNLESSPPANISNIHNGSNNQDNRGIVGHGCRNIVISSNVGCPITFIFLKSEDENEFNRLLEKLRPLQDGFILGVPYDPLNAPPERHPGTSCNCIRERMSNPDFFPQSNIQYSNNNQGNLNITDNSITNTVVSYVVPVDGNELVHLLYFSISEDALHDSLYAPTKCHPGTRITICRSIGKWMLDPAGSSLLWLHGPAGVGKSTIAKTISTTHSNQIRVVGTFFFSTCSDKSAANLFATLAWQLAKNVPGTEEHIVAALKRDHSLTKRGLKYQFDQLIVQPLKKCTPKETSGLLMIIDGVDECVDENVQMEFLHILKHAGAKGDLPLRFLICSRPEPRIRAILETTDEYYATASQSTSYAKSSTAMRPSKPDQTDNPINSTQEQPSFNPREQVRTETGSYFSIVMAPVNFVRRWGPTVLPSDDWMPSQPMQLGATNRYSPSPIEIHDELDKICRCQVISRIQIGLSEESKEDVKKYLTDKFKEICSSDPITSEDIDDLVIRSCGQFLYTSTIVRLLDDPYFSPMDVLKMVRSSCFPSPDLDKLYSVILYKTEQIMREHAETNLVALRDVFAILVVLWENMQFANILDSFTTIESLLFLEKCELMRILRNLHSVL